MKKTGFLSLAAFWGLNFLTSLVIGLGYFLFVGIHPVELAFSIIAYLSNTFMLYAALSMPAAALYFARAGLVVFAPVFAFLQLTLVLDVAIYKIFRFHINSMVLNILFTPGGIKSLDQGVGTEILFAGIALALLALELWLYRLAVRSAAKKKGLAGLLSRRWKLLLTVFMVFTLLDKGLFAWGTLYDKVHITGNAKLFPLYQPLRIRSFASKYLGVKLDEEVKVSISKKYSKLNYPVRPLEIIPPKKPLNIVILVVDSMRFDVMNREVTPNIWEFAKKAHHFENHYSGGNCTRFGIFSIIYGLYGNYWFSLLGERRAPVLMDALKDAGYDIRLYASAELSFPEFNKTCFVNVPREKIYDRPAGKTQAEMDLDINEKFLEFLKTRQSGKPYFAFVFYDAAHGSYDYPDSGFDKFTPASNSVNYLNLTKENIRPLFNKYRNSVRYEDSLVGEILGALERGGLKDTVVLVTSDHGEAFFEKGYQGHNRAYSAEEVKVPLVFYLPGRAPADIKSPTSHMDIVPTLMKLLGVKNPPSDYSSGADLFDRPARPFLPVFSWDTSALIENNYALVMPLEAYNGGVTLHDPEYKEIKGRSAIAPYTHYLVDFQKEAKRFYK